MKAWQKPTYWLVLWGMALAASCSSVRPPEAQILRPSITGATVRVACVGDSITYGSGIAGRETNSYPAVLGRLLGPGFESCNFGVGGATLLKQGDKPYWNLSEFKAVADYAPHAIVIKLGTNDSKPQNWRHGDEFELNLGEMIDRFRALPSRPHIWLCLPVPVYETRWGINELTVKGEIMPSILNVAERKQIPVIDLYTALSDQPECFSDKIHPNAAGARLMAQTVAAALTGR